MKKIIGLLSSIAVLVTGILGASDGPTMRGPQVIEDAMRSGILDEVKKAAQQSSFMTPHRIQFQTVSTDGITDSKQFKKLAAEARERSRFQKPYDKILKRLDTVFAGSPSQATTDSSSRVADAGSGPSSGVGSDGGTTAVAPVGPKPIDDMERLKYEIAGRDLVKRMQDYYDVVGSVEAVKARRGDFNRYNPVQIPLGISQWWTGVYGRNKEIIDSSTKLMVIGSALAFMFNKFGGSEYVRNKIREIFDKPPIYTVRRRKAGFFGSKPTDSIKEEDLILAPSTRKQVNELIFLIRRRYELGKTSKRKFTFPHVLLYGPPGTGKTTIAQMIADNTIGDDGNPMNFITLMASDFMQIKQEGDRLAVLKELFTKAKNLGNTIIFLDEVDSMVQQRGKDNESPNRAFLDMLLLYMTKLSSRYMVIAATNHANKIDDALMSRFRRKIFVNLPTARNRKAILELYIENLLISKGYTSQLDTTAIANIMQGCSGRDLESFVTRLRDRIDFEQGNVATPALAEVILREMGKISGGSDDDISLLDLEDELATDGGSKKE